MQAVAVTAVTSYRGNRGCTFSYTPSVLLIHIRAHVELIRRAHENKRLRQLAGLRIFARADFALQDLAADRCGDGCAVEIRLDALDMPLRFTDFCARNIDVGPPSPGLQKSEIGFCLIQTGLRGLDCDPTPEQILIPNGALVTHALDELQLHVGILILLLGFFDLGFRGRNLFWSGRTHELIQLRFGHCEGPALQTDLGLQITIVDGEELCALTDAIAGFDVHLSHHALHRKADGDVLRACLHQANRSDASLNCRGGRRRRRRHGGMRRLRIDDGENAQRQDQGSDNG